MQFQFTKAVPAKLMDIKILSAKDRKVEDNPGLKFSFQVKVTNVILEMLNPNMRAFLFERAPGAPKQGKLDGVEAVSELPLLTEAGRKMGRFRWHDDYVGYSLHVPYGATGRDLRATDCTVENFKIQGQEGGTALLDFDVIVPDAEDDLFLRSSRLKRQQVDLVLNAPKIQQRALDEQPATTAKKVAPAAKKAPPAAKKAPAKSAARETAEQAFSKAHAPASDVGVLTKMHGGEAAPKH